MRLLAIQELPQSKRVKLVFDDDTVLKTQPYLLADFGLYSGMELTEEDYQALLAAAGKADDVGTTPGWTVSDMKALLASKPEGTQLFWGMDRTSALTALMSLGYNDFINWEDASCNFDSQEFIDVLDFANMFPEEFEYRDDMEDSTVLLSQGKQLLDTYYLSDFEQVQMYLSLIHISEPTRP